MWAWLFWWLGACGTEARPLPAATTHPTTEWVVRQFGGGACPGSPVCARVVASVPAPPPAGVYAGIRYACDRSGLSPLLAAMGERPEQGDAAVWDGTTLRAARDPSAVLDAAACLWPGGRCDRVRLPAPRTWTVGSGEWSRSPDGWIVVEPGPIGCGAVTVLLDAPQGPPRTAGDGPGPLP